MSTWLNKIKVRELLPLAARQKIRLWFKGQLRAIKRLERDDLDLANAGQWPDTIKALSLLLIVGGVVFASHWLLLSSYKEELASARQEQQDFLEDYRRRSFQAANLTAYQQQMRIMEEAFSGLLAFLPTENEIPRLLDDIQQLADQQRIEIQALSIKQPEQQNFYTRLPFEIKVGGDFNRLSSFIAGISSLDRIITLHNFTLTPTLPGTNNLNLVIDAQTYRYDQKTNSEAARGNK